MNQASRVSKLRTCSFCFWTICLVAGLSICSRPALGIENGLLGDDNSTHAPETPPSKAKKVPSEKGSATADAKPLREDARLPLPTPADINKALTTIRGIFKSEYAQKGAENQKALAKKLRQQADETSDDPASRFALLSESRDLSARGGDLAEARRAISTIVEMYQISPEKMTLEMLDVAAKSGAADPSVLAENYLRSGAELLAVDNFDLASKAASKAVTAASKGKGVSLLTRAKQQVASIAELRREYIQVDGARKTLAMQPDDAEANRIVGRYLCLRRDRWTEGLALLAKGSDAELKSLAESELANPSKASDIAALADRWWVQSSKKESAPASSAFRRHAARLYSKAIPDMRGLSKSAAQSRVNEAFAAAEFLNIRVSKCVTEVEHTSEWQWFYPATDTNVPDEFQVKAEPRRIHIAGVKKTDQFALLPGHNSSHYGKSVTFDEMRWGSGEFKVGVSTSGEHGRYGILLVDTAGKVTFNDMTVREGVTYRWTVSEEADGIAFRVDGTDKPTLISIPAKEFQAFGFVVYARYVGDKVDFDATLSTPGK